MISSLLTLRSRIVRFWFARIARAPCSACRAGAPRRIAALRLSGLPASAVPNSLMISERRSLNGSRRVALTRSFWTVVLVWETGTSPLSGRSLWEFPGWQSRKYSAISDCGCEEQVASTRNCDTGPLRVTVTTARLAASMFSSVTVPSVTPATRTSEPCTSPNALSSSIR